MTMDQTEADDDMVSSNDYKPGHKDALDAGAKVRGKIKRGTGTRDQDVIVIEGRGATAVEAVRDFEDALTAAEERDFAGRLRALGNNEENDA